MEDKKYAIELEVVTPLSVGAGNDNEWMRGIDFVQKGRKVYVLDIRKAVEQGVDIDILTSLFENTDEEGISQLIGNNLENVSSLVFDAPVSTTNSIKTFLRTQLYGKPVIAGSSIKGAVRSALFHYLRDNDRTNEEAFGNMKDGTDLMRFVRIADIEMPNTVLINTKLFNLQIEGLEWTGGWKHAMNSTTRDYRPTGFNTLYECVPPGQKGLGSISLAGKAFEVMSSNTDKSVSHREKKIRLLDGDIKELFKIINQVTKGYLLKEKAFFEKYPAQRSEELIDCVNSLLEMIPEDGSCCLLKMSAGVGFHSITGDWLYEDYSETGQWNDGRNAGKKKYKSRKTSEYKGKIQLMGFVKLRTLSADEVSTKMGSLTEEHAEIIDSILELARLREEESQRKQEADIQRKEAAEEEKKKQSEYKQLMEQAKIFYSSGNWDDAIANAEAAKEIYPDKTNKEATSLIEACTKSKEAAQYRQDEQAAAAQRFSQSLAEVIKGKTSAGNLIDTTIKWLKKSNTFGDAELQALVNEARKLPEKEQNKLKGKSKDLVKLVGEEDVKKFLEEVKK